MTSIDETHNSTSGLRDLDMDLLRTFVAVSEMGGFTPAASRLGRTQSAISLRVQKLEGLLGCRVLTRTGKGAELTREGELLLPSAREIVSLNDDIQKTFRARSLDGSLRVGIAEYIVPRHLSFILRQFKTEYSNARLETRVGMGNELMDLLDVGELDIVVAGHETDAERGEVLTDEPLCWIASGEFVSRKNEPLQLALLPPPCSYRREAISALEAHGIAHDIVYTSSSVHGVYSAVEAGIAVTVLAQSAIKSPLEDIGAKLQLPPLPTTTISVFRDQLKYNPLTEPFTEFIRRVVIGQN